MPTVNDPHIAPYDPLCRWSGLNDPIPAMPTGPTVSPPSARAVKRSLGPVLPGAAVDAFSLARPMAGTAFGVAVPEVPMGGRDGCRCWATAAVLGNRFIYVLNF